jgi:hypothetical protein
MEYEETGDKQKQLQALAADIAQAIISEVEKMGGFGGGDTATRAKKCDSGFYCGKYNCSPPFSCSDFGCASTFSFGLVLRTPQRVE